MIDLLLINPGCIGYSRTNIFYLDPYSLFESAPPLGLAYIASICLEAGYNVKIIDMDAEVIDFKRLMKIIEKIKPKLIGISCFSPLFSKVIELSKLIKSAVDIPIIVGGPHACIHPESIMEIETIDYCIMGEGDFACVSLLNYLLRNKGKIETIDGLFYKKDGQVLRNRTPEPISDLDCISFPARHLLKQQLYFNPLFDSRVYTTILTARGCPFRCIFCCQIHKKFRRRSIENVIAEIKEVIEKYGIRNFDFFDDTFNLDSNWAIDFCEKITAQGIRIKWRARCRPDSFTMNIAQNLKKAGCDIISLGVESANNSTLQWFNKMYTIEQVQKALVIIKKSELRLHGYFILGTPLETKEDMLKTIDFACRHKFDFATFSLLTFLPGTKLFDIALNEGFFENYNRRDYSNSIGWCKPTLKHPTINQKELRQLFTYAYKRFYLRPKKIFELSKIVFLNYNIYYKIVRRIYRNLPRFEYLGGLNKRV